MKGETKTAVTVTEMARLCGLSRARFYQLIGSAFPPPSYDGSTRRPFYDQAAQKVCLEVRKKNCGINGKPILFNSRRLANARSKGTPKSSIENKNDCSQLLDGLRALGLSTSSAQVEATLKELGLQGTADGETVREVFLHLRRKGI
jgi:hypothetical protein